MFDNNKNANRLIKEKSPYLLQHAHNPVDWYAWGEEAFQKAKQEKKPIFLSIGYSTCHWCHVMARESFSDEEVAKYLNEHFVSIKVDREERPDIDSVYMKVCQMMTGHGGWPLTIFMTPDKVPFFAGTYFPKKERYGMPGFMEVLKHLHHTYTSDPDKIKHVTIQIKDALKQTTQQKSNRQLTKKSVDEAYEQLEQRFDWENGGFGEAPKFPQPQNLLFLLRYYHATGKERALEMVEHTLLKMAAGGIYDQIGFGFSRYSVDEKWLVPHFEKMLYDQALMVMVYAEAFQITGKNFFRRMGKQIISFVMKEMQSNENVFYSAIDADSEGVEGKYYVWDKKEIIDILGKELGEFYADVYQITDQGNFEGKNIPNRISVDLHEIADKYDLSMKEFGREMQNARQLLLEAREKRIYPHVDDKILTSWNGLMITALAMAGRIFQEKTFTEAAEKAIAFIEKKLIVDGRLMARYRDGETKHKAYLDDHAYLLWAYVELYGATFSTKYLEKGKELLNQMIELFWDDEQAGFFFSGKDAEQMITDDKEVYDGALPSGNSVAAVTLLRMSALTGETKYVDLLDDMYATFFNDISRQASAATFFVQSLLLTEYPTKEVIVLGEQENQDFQAFVQKLQQAFLPDVSLLVSETGENLASVSPFAKDYQVLEGKPTAYICKEFTCEAPINDLEEAMKKIVKK